MYFDSHFDAFAFENSNDEALLKTLEMLLFKSSTSSKFSRVSDKLADFWSSKFTEKLTAEQMNGENFILALSQYIRSKSIDEDKITELLKLNQDSVIKAVRQSGIIARPDHCSWIILKKIAIQIDFSKLDEFLRTVEYIQLQYQERVDAYKALKNQLQLDQVTAMVFSSFYAYEYLIIESDYLNIPYQIDANDNISI